MTQNEALKQVLGEMGVDVSGWSEVQYHRYLYSLGRAGGRTESGRRLMAAIEKKTGQPFETISDEQLLGLAHE